MGGLTGLGTFGAQRARSPARRGTGCSVNPFLQLFADFKEGKLFWKDLNGFTSSGISPRVLTVFTVDETAKASNFDAIPLDQGFRHRVEDQINHLFGLLFRDSGFFRNDFNEFGLIHNPPFLGSCGQKQ